MRTVIIRNLLGAAVASAVLVACGDSPPPTAPEPRVSVMPLARTNHPPVAAMYVHRHRVEGNILKFTSTPSYDEDAWQTRPMRYFWDFGDGAGAWGPHLSHVYADNGNYTVTLTVTDADGASDKATETVAIRNANPQPGSISAPPSLVEGVAFQLSAAGFRDLGPKDQAAGFTYSFDCGGGSWSAWSASATITCRGRPDNGEFTLRARARDKDGGEGLARRNVDVANRPPRITLAAVAHDPNAPLGIIITVRGNDVTNDQGGGEIEVRWGDGSPPTKVATQRGGQYYPILHNYAAAGRYTATILLTDKDGMRSNPVRRTFDVP
jgi:PKD domain